MWLEQNNFHKVFIIKGKALGICEDLKKNTLENPGKMSSRVKSGWFSDFKNHYTFSNVKLFEEGPTKRFPQCLFFFSFVNWCRLLNSEHSVNFDAIGYY